MVEKPVIIKKGQCISSDDECARPRPSLYHKEDCRFCSFYHICWSMSELIRKMGKRALGDVK